jgi:hypothetical protein
LHDLYVVGLSQASVQVEWEGMMHTMLMEFHVVWIAADNTATPADLKRGNGESTGPRRVSGLIAPSPFDPLRPTHSLRDRLIVPETHMHTV